MRIVIAGGTGFLGSPLAEAYAEEGHDVRVLTRSLPPGESRHESGTGVPGITRVGWKPDGHRGAPQADVVNGADAVINLAGASIGDTRWTPQRKAELRDSRIVATRSLAVAIRETPSPPAVFISASGIDYYGSSDGPKTEGASPGESFLAHLCEDWEKEAHRADRDGVRLATIRSGIVLERSGGALARMVTPFRLFVGGPVGSGRQYISWIHRLDWIEMVRWIVQTPAASGAFNLTAPHPVTNRVFARALGRALKRPALVPVPALALKLAVGELADYLVAGPRASPARALSLGYAFRYPEIDMAFRGIFGE